MYVEAKVSGQWKRNIFLAAGFYGAEAGGNIEFAAHCRFSHNGSCPHSLLMTIFFLDAVE